MNEEPKQQNKSPMAARGRNKNLDSHAVVEQESPFGLMKPDTAQFSNGRATRTGASKHSII